MTANNTHKVASRKAKKFSSLEEVENALKEESVNDIELFYLQGLLHYAFQGELFYAWGEFRAILHGRS